MKSKIVFIFLLSIIFGTPLTQGADDVEESGRMQAELELLLNESQDPLLEIEENTETYRFNPKKSKNKKLAADVQEDEVSLTMSAVKKTAQESNQILKDVEKMEANEDFEDPLPMERSKEFQYRPRRKRSR